MGWELKNIPEIEKQVIAIGKNIIKNDVDGESVYWVYLNQYVDYKFIKDEHVLQCWKEYTHLLC